METCLNLYMELKHVLKMWNVLFMIFNGTQHQCFVCECLVKFYKQQTTNTKSLCKTFADRAQQLQFVDLYIETHTPLNTLQEHERAEVLQAKTKKGMELKDFLSSVDDDTLPPTVKEQYQHNGIFLGSSKVSERQKADIMY